MLRYLILCNSFLFAAYEITDYAMYTFDVGQGNCQVAIYKMEDIDIRLPRIIGFLVDCGSSETNYDKRFDYTPSNDYTTIIQGGGNSPTDNSGNIDHSKILPIDIDSVKLQETVTHDREFKESFNDYCENIRKIRKKENYVDYKIHRPIYNTKVQNIRSKLFDHVADCLLDVNLLIILLSHPDDDHINKVKHVVEKIKKEEKKADLKVISFLGGDWLSKSKNTQSAQDARQYLSENACMFTPYYCNNENGKNPAFFSGNLMDLLNKYTKLDNNNYQKGGNYNNELVDKFQKIRDEVLNIFNKPLEAIKDYVNILSMNTKGEGQDPYNEQSSIIQFIFKDKIRKNKYTEFICTGDADDSTVSAMKSGKLYKLYYSDESKISRDIEFLKKEYASLGLLMSVSKESHKYLRYLIPTFDVDTILTIPHHGAYAQSNEKKATLDTIKTVFKPDVFIISAGSGYKSAHPYIDLITLFKNDTFNQQYGNF